MPHSPSCVLAAATGPTSLPNPTGSPPAHGLPSASSTSTHTFHVPISRRLNLASETTLQLSEPNPPPSTLSPPRNEPPKTHTMSVIREHTSATLSDAWRTIDIDSLDPDKVFDISTLHPAIPETSVNEVRALHGQVRQLLQGRDTEGALRGCLEFPVYNGDNAARDAHLQTVLEVLQSIKASEMNPMLVRIFNSEGGSECLDVLMKYLYKGMANSANVAPKSPMKPMATGFSQIGGRSMASHDSTGAAMSVLLSWHEKVVEVAGLGCIGRVMTDWRRV
ncbi:hypothetical protein MKZ38_003329 [Zalerion maritima]|uniref:Actin-related protein 2/3 complex subunit 5 n=1 Tax=Zalerion maritima TaxID=339359 RepID=A0AAD5RMY0_9PEZI|nr:hypothetical protein MKZ38_003329 [Zalerion maritima]